MNLLLRPASYWTVRHVKDQVIEVNGGRLNLDLLYRVLRAKAVADLRANGGGRIRESST